MDLIITLLLFVVASAAVYLVIYCKDHYDDEE